MSRDIDPRGIPLSGLAYVGEMGLVSPLVQLPGSSRGEVRLQMYTEGIRMQKYLGKKAATTALNALQQLSWLH